MRQSWEFQQDWRKQETGLKYHYLLVVLLGIIQYVGFHDRR